MTPDERVEANQWLKETLTLQDFLWDAQPQIVKPIADYLTAWADWQYQRLTNRKIEKPAPFLFLWGPFGTGKTELVARGIARYFVLNLSLPMVQYIYWPYYVKDQLNGKKLQVNWSASLTVIDDFDGRRVIPESMSTWLLEDMLAVLKPRGEVYKLPTIIITNRAPGSLEEFFSVSSTGKSNDDTRHSAKQVMTALSRHTFTAPGFKNLPEKYSRESGSRGDHNAWLREQARKTNDMQALGFYYPREKYGVEVSF